jgi:hypothetical protein
MSKRIRNVMFISLFFIAAGCASSQHFYSGTHRPGEELAIIKPSRETWLFSAMQIDVFPTLIDGNPTGTYRAILPSYFVLPGEHTLEIAFTGFLDGPAVRFKDPTPMTFYATAGHIYETKAATVPSLLEIPEHGGEVKVGFWVEDVGTGEVVGGTRITDSETLTVE